MKLSKSIKISLAAWMALGLFGSFAARADVGHTEAYESLTAAAPQSPAQAPHAVNGMAALSASEFSHHERLPFQLDGAMTKIKKSKYSPRGLSRESVVDF